LTTLVPQDSRPDDTGVLLATPTNDNFAKEPRPEVKLDRPDPSPPLSRPNTPTPGGLLTVPGAGAGSGSIALRAIRSVRSLARIGGWGQVAGSENQSAGVKEKKEKEDGKEKKKKKKEKEKEPVIRASTSSFEAGALSSASPQAKKTATATVGPSMRKKPSILNPGLSSSTRVPTLRGGSTASSIAPPVSNRLSVDGVKANSEGVTARSRGGSTMSDAASSLRPLSSSSSASHLSTGSSIRWDEECLENVKMRRKKDREGKERKEKRKEKREDGDTGKKGATKESRRSLEGRRRTLLTDVFPEAHRQPIVTIEEATLDGHGTLIEEEEEGRDAGEQCEPATPAKRARPRPVSDQFLDKPRPKGIYEDKDGVWLCSTLLPFL
jgi:serine/arginine repetitive matrix protein 2